MTADRNNHGAVLITGASSGIGRALAREFGACAEAAQTFQDRSAPTRIQVRVRAAASQRLRCMVACGITAMLAFEGRRTSWRELIVSGSRAGCGYNSLSLFQLFIIGI